MRRSHCLAGSCLSVLAGAVLLTGCSGDDQSEEQAGALAAAQEYVEAIAALDVETVDAMTDPDAFTEASGPDADVDIRTALPEAEDPIEDPWVSLVSSTYDSRQGPTEFVVGVSYELDGLTGGGTIEIRLDEDGDPAEVGDWTVTDPLIVRGETFADETTVPTGRIGPVELRYGPTSHVGVWGYPGGYLLEPAKPTRGVRPLWIAVGAADAPRWRESLPMLERASED